LKIFFEIFPKFYFKDVNSWKSLDLIQIDSKPKKGVINSLFDVINSCVTPGGTKTLRSYLLQPSANCQTINKRLDIVEELVLNQSVCLKKIFFNG